MQIPTHTRFEAKSDVSSPHRQEAALGGGGGGLIQVTLKSMAPESSHIAPVSRKLPGSMTVSSIKRMCQQLFGLDLGKQRLFCRWKP